MIRVPLRDADKSNLDLGGRFTDLVWTLEADSRINLDLGGKLKTLAWTLEAG